MSTTEAAENSGNQNFRTLLDFSLGRIDDLTIKDALGIDNDEDLFLLMAQAHLPMPRLPASQTKTMWETLHSLPFEAS
ncbi:MAG: hypothetical protein R3E95_12795 [Thiolinea sp.]